MNEASWDQVLKLGGMRGGSRSELGQRSGRRGLGVLTVPRGWPPRAHGCLRGDCRWPLGPVNEAAGVQEPSGLTWEIT